MNDTGIGSGLITPHFLRYLEGGTGTVTLLEPQQCFHDTLLKQVTDNPGKVLYKQLSIADGGFECVKNRAGYDMIFARYMIFAFMSQMIKIVSNHFRSCSLKFKIVSRKV